MLSNTLRHCFQQLTIRSVHATPALSSSVFIKKQKQIDPQQAKIREKRKRRKLEMEIRKLQREPKRPKPVTEIVLDAKIAEKIDQYKRVETTLSDAEIDDRAIVHKAYAKSRSRLDIEDGKWIRQMLADQERALNVLREMSPELYKAAIQPGDDYLPFSFKGPRLTAPIKDYHCPDGDYIDTTPDWTKQTGK